jgi:hypothetical protein
MPVLGRVSGRIATTRRLAGPGEGSHTANSSGVAVPAAHGEERVR